MFIINVIFLCVLVMLVSDSLLLSTLASPTLFAAFVLSSTIGGIATLYHTSKIVAPQQILIAGGVFMLCAGLIGAVASSPDVMDATASLQVISFVGWVGALIILVSLSSRLLEQSKSR